MLSKELQFLLISFSLFFFVIFNGSILLQFSRDWGVGCKLLVTIAKVTTGVYCVDSLVISLCTVHDTLVTY